MRKENTARQTSVCSHACEERVQSAGASSRCSSSSRRSKGSAVRFSGSSATWAHCRGVLHVCFPSVMWTASERYGGQHRPNALQQFKKKHFECVANNYYMLHCHLCQTVGFVGGGTDLQTISASQYYLILFVVFFCIVWISFYLEF